MYRIKGLSKIGCARIGAEDSLFFSSSKDAWHGSDQGIGVFELHAALRSGLELFSDWNDFRLFRGFAIFEN